VVEVRSYLAEDRQDRRGPADRHAEGVQRLGQPAFVVGSRKPNSRLIATASGSRRGDRGHDPRHLVVGQRHQDLAVGGERSATSTTRPPSDDR
jgi:hypothetical protein